MVGCKEQFTRAFVIDSTSVQHSLTKADVWSMAQVSGNGRPKDHLWEYCCSALMLCSKLFPKALDLGQHTVFLTTDFLANLKIVLLARLLCSYNVPCLVILQLCYYVFFYMVNDVCIIQNKSYMARL